MCNECGNHCAFCGEPSVYWISKGNLLVYVCEADRLKGTEYTNTTSAKMAAAPWN